ncbi:hypothetical protein [Helicobacter pylori]|uniref:hypothetical protein n=1 Tax=Helicobacter pylori TaxID=210 RepID=UPI001FD52266|nr:hypothetical protein [Helicobacter pylori]UOS46330.1 hypothetical protein MPG09_06305 [Helicobacter pylori]
MFFSWAVFSGSPKHFLRLDSVLKSIHSLKTFVYCLLFDNPLTLQEESGLKLALYGCDGVRWWG